jgi:AbiV family abortive infection protein
LLCYDAGHPAVAFALSLTTIEEIGKVSVERLRLVGARRINVNREAIKPLSIKTSFYRHETKHYLAAIAGALVNSRLDRVLGIDFVIAFIEAAETGALERMRRDALYMDRQDGRLLLPMDTISFETAARYVALAGELLAEVGGFANPQVWDRLLQRVDEFERAVGLVTADEQQE